MGTSIRVSEGTKSMLAVLKEEDETWDEFLARLARRERDVNALGGFGEAGIVESMDETDRRLSESFERNAAESDDLSG